MSRVDKYVWAIVFLCTITVLSVTSIVIFRPERDNSSIITTIFGFTGPVIIALVAGTLRENHLAMNSRLDNLLEETRISAYGKGKLDRDGAQ